MKRALPFTLLLAVCVFAQDLKSAQQVARAGTSTQTVSGQASASLVPSQIFSRARSSVVVIVATDQNGQREALGSGFIVSHGRIATNHHVVEGMNEAYVVFSDGDVKPVSRVVADSAQQDLIVLATETGNRSPLVFGDELSLQQGDPVYALGAPKGLELTFTNGIVSSFRKSNAQFLIQTTAPIAPGSSGGPLFDRMGRVVGVTTSLISDAPGIYFSVGIGDVKRLLRTPQGVALPFDEWAKEQAEEHVSASPHFAGPNAAQTGQNSSPSLQDSISWMQNFSQPNGLGTRDGKETVINALHQNPFPHNSRDDCMVVITTDFPYRDGKRLANGGIRDTASIDIIDLRDINPESVKVGAYNKVEFETTDPSGKIDSIAWSDPSVTSSRVFSPGGLAQVKTIEMFVAYGVLSFNSVESAQRFATALKHAVTLCGGTTAPF